MITWWSTSTGAWSGRQSQRITRGPWAAQYIDAGADLVIGSHPHVLQPVEYYNGKPIVYSLGNFVFGSSIPSTILFKVVLDGEEIQVTEIPCTSSGGYTRLK